MQVRGLLSYKDFSFSIKSTKKKKTSAAAVGPRHLKVEVTD